MKQQYKDYIITVNKIENASYGPGYRAEWYIPQAGLKKHLYVLYSFDKTIKSQAQMLKKTIEILEKL